MFCTFSKCCWDNPACLMRVERIPGEGLLWRSDLKNSSSINIKYNDYLAPHSSNQYLKVEHHRLRTLLCCFNVFGVLVSYPNQYLALIN